jgi:hypothetical protein
MSKLSAPRKAKRVQDVALLDADEVRHGVAFENDTFDKLPMESKGANSPRDADVEEEGDELDKDAENADEEDEVSEFETEEWSGVSRKGKKLLNPDDPERSWLPPLKEFLELKELNPESEGFKEAFRIIQDMGTQTRADRLDANDLNMFGEPIQYLYRFLRTLSREQLEQWRKEYLRQIKEKELGEPFAGNVIRNPNLYRGAPYAFRGVLVDKYYTYSWKIYEGGKHGGVPCANLFFCRSSGAGKNYYGVLVPTEGKGLVGSREEKDAPDRVEWTGLFLTIWPYKSRMDDKWMSMPVYVAAELRKIPLAEEENRTWMYVLAALGFLAVGALAVYLKRDAQRAEELGKILREQRYKLKRERKNKERKDDEKENADEAVAAPPPE